MSDELGTAMSENKQQQKQIPFGNEKQKREF
jgi:hypothetical protein